MNNNNMNNDNMNNNNMDNNNIDNNNMVNNNMNNNNIDNNNNNHNNNNIINNSNSFWQFDNSLPLAQTIHDSTCITHIHHNINNEYIYIIYIYNITMELKFSNVYCFVYILC